MNFYDATTGGCAKLEAGGWIAADGNRPEDVALADILNGSIADIKRHAEKMEPYISVTERMSNTN
jgi:hypothetical protein